MGSRSTELREIRELKSLAAWYRSWAELAGDGEERESRLRLAALIEAKIAVVVFQCRDEDEDDVTEVIENVEDEEEEER